MPHGEDELALGALDLLHGTYRSATAERLVALQ